MKTHNMGTLNLCIHNIFTCIFFSRRNIFFLNKPHLELWNFTLVDEELVKHLEEEIANEKSADVQRTPKIDGWDIKTNVSEVILQRKNGDET